jgi:hypothetical protein
MQGTKSLYITKILQRNMQNLCVQPLYTSACQKLTFQKHSLKASASFFSGAFLMPQGLTSYK